MIRAIIMVVCISFYLVTASIAIWDKPFLLAITHVPWYSWVSVLVAVVMWVSLESGKSKKNR